MTRPTEAVSDSRLASSALWHDRLRKRISPDGVRAVFACRWIDSGGHRVGPVEYEEVFRAAGEPERYGFRVYGEPSPDAKMMLGIYDDEADALAAWDRRLGARRNAPHVEVLGVAKLRPAANCPDCAGTGFVHSYYSNRTEPCACWN